MMICQIKNSTPIVQQLSHQQLQLAAPQRLPVRILFIMSVHFMCISIIYHYHVSNINYWCCLAAVAPTTIATSTASTTTVGAGEWFVFRSYMIFAYTFPSQHLNHVQ